MEQTQNRISDERLAEFVAWREWDDPDGLQHDATLMARELTALREELRLQKGANAAQDERERKAAERLGMVHCCDWPEQVADELEALRATLGDAGTVHINILRGVIALTKGQAIHIAGLPANIEEQLAALRASHKRMVEALEKFMDTMSFAPSTVPGAIENGLNAAYEMGRAALADARKLEGK